MSGLRRGGILISALVFALVAAGSAQAGATTEVVVELDRLPLARAVAESRVLTAAAR